MALLDDLLKGNVVTALAVGIGAYLLAPTVGPALRPAAKAIIKLGIQAYQGLAELGEVASDVTAEARSELENRGETELEPTQSAPAGRDGRRTKNT